MAKAVDTSLEAVRAMVRDAFLDTSVEWDNDPALYDAHPTEYEVASYLDRGLDEAAEAEFERHVAFCAPCAEELVLASRTAAGQRRREKSSYWRMAAGISLAIGSLIAAVLAGRSVGGYLEGALVAGLEAGLGGKSSVDGVSISLLGGPKVDLDGLTVRDRAGGDPLVAAPSAHLDVDLASLGSGQLSGDLELDRPVFNLVRDASGRVNLDALLPSSAGIRGLFAEAAKGAVRSVSISDGTIRIVDRSGTTPREVRMADVDAKMTDLSGDRPATVRARAGLESSDQNLSVVARVGPWGNGVVPKYDLTEVTLDAVPLRALVGHAVRGGLTYAGRLQTAGDGWDQISSNVSGSGRMQVVSGALVGRNLLAETVKPLLAAEGDPAPHLGALLARRDTPFDEISTPVVVRRFGLQATGLVARGEGFEVRGGGTLEGSGAVDFNGTLAVAPELASELIAVAPTAGALLDENGELAIPFEVAGTWPDVKARVDVELLANRTLERHRLAILWLAPFALPSADAG